MKNTLFIFFIFVLLLSACAPTSSQAPAVESSLPQPVLPASQPDKPAAETEQQLPQSQPAVTPASASAAALSTDYPDALSVRNQLAIGAMKLSETDQALSPAQAQEMLLLWQTLRALQNSGTAAEAENAALLAQIEGLLTPAQAAAIRDLKLTTVDMQTWAAENGISLGQGGGEGQGAGKNMSPEARATKQAEEGRIPGTSGSSGNSASTAILDSVIRYIEGLAQ